MAELLFNASTGLAVPETADIRSDIVTKIQAAFQTSPDEPLLNCEPSSPMGQVVDLIVAEIEAKNAEIVFLMNMVNPNTAQGKFLDALAALYGLSRKISEPTIVSATLTGLKGTNIPYGAIAQDSNGNQFRHNVGGGVTIPNAGSIVSTFASVEHGAVSVAPGALNQIVTVIAGWDGITNAAAGATGRDEETDAELRNRITASYAINATSYVEAIEANLAELPGVIDVKVLENFTDTARTIYSLSVNPHSIAVCIVGGADADIARTIFERKDAGCGTTGAYLVSYVATEYNNATYTYRITRPSAASLKVKVEFFADNLGSDLVADIKAAIVADILGQGANDRIGLAETVYASRFYAVVQGVTDSPIKTITVALDSGAYGASVAIPATKEPTTATTDVTIVQGA